MLFFARSFFLLVERANSMQLNEIDSTRLRALQQWAWMGRKERLLKQLSRCKFVKEVERKTKIFSYTGSS